jgi:hypothetical protein
MTARLLVLAFLGWSECRCGDIEVAAHIEDRGQHLFMVRDTASHEKSGWLSLGDSWRGHTLSAFDAQSDKLIRTRDPAGYHERLIRVRAAPQPGFKSKPFERLVLVADNSTYRMEWRAGASHQAPILVQGQHYDFVLIERSHPRLYGARVWHDVSRVSLGVRVLFDRSVCEVHGGRLESKFIPTRHGYSGFPDIKALDIRRRHFPHAESGRSVACEAQPDEPAMTEIWTCRPCEVAYQQWAKDRTRFER